MHTMEQFHLCSPLLVGTWILSRTEVLLSQSCELYFLSFTIVSHKIKRSSSVRSNRTEVDFYYQLSLKSSQRQTRNLPWKQRQKKPTTLTFASVVAVFFVVVAL